VYLGAAPGVGKTFAMLDEGYRRSTRGADVVVGFVETHGRKNTIAQLRDLEITPRRSLEYRDTVMEEMDVDAVLARRADVALVDELAHTNVPGSRNIKRWQDVDELLAAGINVITTVNIQHLESLNDVVETITGIVQRETVPDNVVRSADQIELVDMSPEALRRRMAHGNIYPPQRIDAALSNYFREGNLGALRELALLWVADRVEDALDTYRDRHDITATWETRERVVVAITGAPGGEALIRRAGRIASRARGQLIGVHVHSGDGRREVAAGQLERHRDLVGELGGTYHEVPGDEIAGSLVEFARSVEATQLVLGASRRSRLTEIIRGSIVSETVRAAAGIDVHVIASREGQPPMLTHRSNRPQSLPARRRLAGWSVVLLGLPLFTLVATQTRSHFTLATDLLVYLLVVVAAGAVGGLGPGIVGAVLASLLANFYLVEPRHTFTINEVENLVSLVVFVIVAAITSGYVQLSARRTTEARRASAEAEALARTAATMAGTPDPLPLLVDQVRTIFGLDGVAVVHPIAWEVVAGSGVVPTSAVGATVLPLDERNEVVLVLAGGRLVADDHRVLRALADQLAVALSAGRLRAEATRAEDLAEVDRARTALLQSVSHDLRTPLASIKASVTSLLSREVEFPAETRAEFLCTIDSEVDRLNRLVGNLLDMSRLQAGAMTVQAMDTDVGDVVATALDSLSAPPHAVVIDVAPSLTSVWADPVLLERALANVLANAARFEPTGSAVIVSADAVGDRVHLRVVDHGPGIDESQRVRVLQPFQRAGDNPAVGGVGLGLAVANGFVKVMGGDLILDDTAGGGLTVVIELPVPLVGDPPVEWGAESAP
jgi:two-component system, OmpR family, sensor histidine kinase KdpD